MGDPGLHSKFVEMQQEAAFGPQDHAIPENPYIKGLELDRARVLAELKQARAKNHVVMLQRSLRSIEQKLFPKGVS